MNIGILGGAFNPPTVGHVRLAECALLGADLDAVWLMPSANHPYGKEMADQEERLLMCFLALEDLKHRPNLQAHISVSDFEIANAYKLSGYTIDTLKELQNICPHDTFMPIIGMDNANTIHKWKGADELIETTPFIVCTRRGEEPAEDSAWYLKKPHTFIDTMSLNSDGGFDIPYVPQISSTDVRAAVKDSDEVVLLNAISGAVRAFIGRRGLYQ